MSSRVAAWLLLGDKPVPAHRMPCCGLSVNRQCRVDSLSPFMLAEFVKPAASLFFQAWLNQGLLDALAKFLNCQLTLPM